MKGFTWLFGIVHGLMAFLFACAALMLIIIAARTGGAAFVGGLDRAAAQSIIEAVGLLAAAVVALQIAETIVAEEVVRSANISAPTRVRRFLSRFFVVVVVALAIEGLVATFRALHEDPANFCMLRASWLRLEYCLPPGAYSFTSTVPPRNWSRRQWRTQSEKTKS